MGTLNNFFVKFRVFNFNNPLCHFRAVTCVTSEVQKGFNKLGNSWEAVVLLSQDKQNVGGGGQLVF